MFSLLLKGRPFPGDASKELQTLIDCIEEGVVVLSEDGQVLTVNQAALDLLGISDPATPAPLVELVHRPALRSLLGDAVGKAFSSREVTIGDRSLIVSSRAVEGGGTVVTLMDVTEIRRVEMVRRDFVANASHELKTPLTAIRGFAETLLDDDPPEHLRRQWLEAIRTNTVRLQRLVDDLLDLSRLESGGWIAHQEVVELRPLATEIVDEFQELSRQRDLALRVQGEAMVLADAQGLEQVLRNLLDNAIRYTPAGGAVSVSLIEEGEVGKVTVADTGPGIPAAALPRIFERFYRLDPSRARPEGGTGLGLAIVRHLIQAMGGEVWAESEPGRGTRIVFTVPRARESEDLEP